MSLPPESPKARAAPPSNQPLHQPVNLPGEAGRALRRRAEDQIGARQPLLPGTLAHLSTEAAHNMLHTLEVQRIELMMQNDELRRSQAELELLRSRYFDLYDLAPVGYCSVDANGLVQTSNLTAASLLGVARIALLQRRFSAFIHPDDQDQHYHHRRALLRSREPQTYELRLRKSDGSYFWAQINTTLAPDDDGQPVVRTVLTDVSARKDADKALHDSDRRFRDLVDSTDGIVWEADAQDLLYLSVSGNAERMLGYPAADWLLPGFWARHLHPADRDQTLAQRHSLIQQREHHELEYRFQARDGRLVWLHDSVTLVNEPGQPLRLRGLMVDISQRKAEFEELERHRHHLEATVQTRTAELSLASEQALHSNKAKSEFLAVMSHEIRTPMNAILGFNYLLKETVNTPQQKLWLTKAGEAGHHLMAIIDDILDLAKIEAGRVALRQNNFLLSALLGEVQSQVANSVQIKGLSLVVEQDASPQWLRGDLTRLRQALLNYVGNAVKFTAHGGVILRAHCSEDDGQGVLLRVEVEDTGPGLSADALQRLFQPFEQIDMTPTRQHGGTGLGLVITRRLAERMGGQANATSRLGQGSTFWFTARLGRGQEVVLAVPAAPAPVADEPEDLLRREHRQARVLLVEDDAVNREIASFYLKNVDLQVTTADNGEQALQLARTASFDLVLMDMRMPVMNGLQAARAIRLLPGWQQVPILALTANAFDEDYRDCLAAGMNGLVTKPIDVEVLYARMLEWLRRAAQSQGKGKV